MGLSKPWGVWEGGFDERLGGPPAGYVDLSGVGRAWVAKRCQSRGETLSDMNLKKSGRFYAANLTNGLTLRHLQNRISGAGH